MQLRLIVGLLLLGLPACGSCAHEEKKEEPSTKTAVSSSTKPGRFLKPFHSGVGTALPVTDLPAPHSRSDAGEAHEPK